MLVYLLFRFGISILPRLPRRFLVPAANLVGALVYVTNAGARTAVHRNLAVVLPEADQRTRRRLAVRTFVNGALGYLDLFALAHATAEDLIHDYPIEGWEHLDAAFAQGNGVIMVTCHAGTPSAAGQIIALHGAKPTLVVEQLQPPAVHELVARLRGAFGVHIITIGREGLREMISALRRNELVGIVSDRDVAGSGRELPFFGVPTRVTTAAASLALRTNAIVVPAFAARAGLLAGRGRIEPPVAMPRSGDTAADVREGTLRILARIEAFIREHPDQWAVFDDMWPANDGKVGSSTIPRP